MAEETRRSARATKGQNSKIDSLDQTPEPTKKKGKRGKKVAVAVEDPAEVIRCVCGAIETGDDDKDPWIACDGCDVWQHNICMGISAYGEDVPEKYYCEQCNPQHHKELLASIRLGEKLWEERRRIYAEEQAENEPEESSVKKKAKKKGGKRGSDQNSEANASNGGKAASSTPIPLEKKPIQRANSSKRKAPDELRALGDTPKEPQAKVRKVSAVQTPRQESPHSGSPVKIVDIDSSRQGAAKVLLKGLLHSIPQAIKAGIYTLSVNDTLEAKAERLAIQVENAVHSTHPDKNAYAKQCRAIASNIKQNPELSTGLLTRTLSPEALATMSTDDMASKELKKEKEEMKARADKQSIMITDDGPRVRRTHKGEELVEGDSFAVTTDSNNSPLRRRSKPDLNADTTTRSRENSPEQVELPADIDDYRSRDDIRGYTIPKHPVNTRTQGSASPKTTSMPQEFDINKVFSSVQATDSQSPVHAQHPRRASNNAPPVSGPGDDPEIDKLLQDDGNESPPYSPAEYDSDPSIVWRGTVTMDSVARFPAVAKHIGGVDITKSMTSVSWADVLAKDLKIAGRIDHEKANEYLCSLRYSPPTDLVVVSVTATGEAHAGAFTDLYDYFQSRARYGVLTNKGIGNIRDTYLVPVPPSPDTLPDFIINLEGHRVPEQRSEPIIVIALVIRNEWQPSPEHHPPVRLFDGIADNPSTIQPHQRQMSFSGTGPQMSPIGPPQCGFPPAPVPTLAHFRADEQQREMDQRQGEEAARRILGEYVHAPTIAFLLPQAYQMREVEWNVIRTILQEDQKARDDLQHLSVVLEHRMAGTR